jgi:hypothetical protein
MVPCTSTDEYWIFQRRLLPHGQAILTGMKSMTRAGMDIDDV